MHLRKLFKKNKKSILSAALAALLTFSFNYSPISLLSSMIKKSSAYKSSTTQTYYGNSTTENETKISGGKYPSQLSEFFKESSNNFNIETYYSKRFLEKYAEYVHNYLSSVETEGVIKFKDDYNTTIKFNEAYADFLDAKKYETLYDYYKTESTYISSEYGCKDFYAYVEYFVSNQYIITQSSSNKSDWKGVPALFTQSPTRTHFYSAIANFMIPGTADDEIPGTTADGSFDGVPNNAKPEEFYEYSVSYNRVKKIIDDYIIETVAIYSYDGFTKNNNMAGILAKDAPLSQSYYLLDSYIKANIPNNRDYEKTEKTDKTTGKSYSHIAYYYFGTQSELEKNEDYNSKSDAEKQWYIADANISSFNANPLKYKLISQNDPEGGYLNGLKTYYKFDSSSTPYEKLGSNPKLYVLDDDVTPEENAAYKSLFCTVITSEDIEKDETFAEKNGLPSGYFIKLPYDTTDYYQAVTSYQDEKFEKFCDIVGGKLYIKAANNITNIVYIDKSENNGKSASDFMRDNPNYDYIVKDITLSDPLVNDKAFVKVTASDNRYYATGYTLYFQKEVAYFEELDTRDSTYEKDTLGYVYETTEVPNIPYETHKIPDASYELTGDGRKIFALAENTNTSIKINDVNYAPITQEMINAERNYYVEVSEKTYASVYGSNERTHKLYHMHKSQYVNKIYILDDSKKAADNEVYKNLYYSVITTETYKAAAGDYIEIAKTDKNYNSNFKLYYKYAAAIDSKEAFVQNPMKDDVALFYVDNDVSTDKEKEGYGLNLISVITEDEFNAEKDFFVQIPKSDPRYSTQYTKLYYKYQAKENSTQKVIYLHSSDKSDTYKTFSSSDSGFVASDYTLIDANDPNYVEGLDLYYKKIRTETYSNYDQQTYFYFESSSTLKLSVNSFYAISFYVNTTGKYDGVNDIQASLYITDSSNSLEEMKFEHISTNGKWVKYYAFIATDPFTAPSLKLTMYMGDKTSIAGNVSGLADDTTVTGSVLFDDIKIIKINETDFAKRYIDDTEIKAEEEHKNEDEEITNTVDVIFANDIFTDNVYDYRTYSTIKTTVGSWNSMFKFEDNDELANAIENLSDVTKDTDANTPFGNNEMWKYYISRDVSIPGTEFELKQFQNAYKNNHLLASIVTEDSIDKTSWKDKKDEEDKEDKEDKENKDDKDDKEEKDEGKPTVTDTFNFSNKVLKLENKNSSLTLGLVSNGFEIKRFNYYKITVWVYSPEEEASATLSVNSVIKTASTPDYGTMNTTTATIDANFETYSNQVNEYGWIPITFFIEGNTMHDQVCNLVLSAGANCTVYFDNITIQNISSANYDTANSDSDKTTYCLSLVPSKTLVSNGVTNGYFNTITLKNNYVSPIETDPKEAKSWTANTKNSASVIAGIVPTDKSYTTLSNNFYQLYNGTYVPYTTGYNANNSYNNVYGIYAPATRDASFDGGDTGVATTNIHKIYSSSISLSASKTYEISFDFYKGHNFSGNLVANLYYGSVDAAKIISNITIDASTLTNYSWSTYKFYVTTALSSVTAYIEFGVENAKGTSFFKDVYCIESTESLDAIRDNLISESDKTTDNENLFNKTSLKNIKFINFNEGISSIHGIEIDPNSNLYSVNEYKNDLSNTSAYTVGQTGVAVGSYYDNSEITKTYSVTIDKTTYYIRSFEDKTTNETVYKLYLYNNCNDDCLDKHEVKEIGGQPVTVESFKKVIVGENASAVTHTSTETKKTNYVYTFTEDYLIGDTHIAAEELTNAQSPNVMIITNNYSTDYTLVSPVYTKSLKTSSFYILKVYVKTSDFESVDFGLNINIKSISNAWFNVNTTESETKDEYGFVCYSVLIKTNTSSISNLGVTFSLGTEKVTGKGYAIISAVTLDAIASEDEFNHYESLVDEDDTTTKKYFGTASSENTDDEVAEEDTAITWATFFYIFSSLLLVITIVIALVAVILKKHPIKVSKKVENDHERSIDIINTQDSVKTTSRSRKRKEEQQEETEIPDNGSDGII